MQNKAVNDSLGIIFKPFSDWKNNSDQSCQRGGDDGQAMIQHFFLFQRLDNFIR